MRRFKSYSEIIEYYRWNGRLKSLDGIAWIQKAANLREAIELACTSRQENGKLFFHQRWLDEEAAQLGIKELVANLDDIAVRKDFDLLFRLVDALVGQIDGLKEMFVYDIAFRIGAYKKVCVSAQRNKRWSGRNGIRWRPRNDRARRVSSRVPHTRASRGRESPLHAQGRSCLRAHAHDE